jgi:hypothetical protein
VNQIQVENQVDKIVMPDNLKVGLMVAEQREKCASGDRNEDIYGLGFGQSPFHVPPILSKALGQSLLSCPFHIAVVTGDACMLGPDDFGARIAFVDYDGKSTYDDYKNNKPNTLSDEIEFVKRNTPLMVRSTNSLKKWIKFIKNN